MTEDTDELIGRSYTRARKHPLVIGKLPGAGRLPGGPYTITQIVTMTVTFVVLILTRALWAHFGVVDVAVLVIVPWGLAWVLRYARLDGRDPARALRSLTGYAAAPTGGRFAGGPLRIPRPAALGAACTVRLRPGAAEAVSLPAPAVQHVSVAAPARSRAGREAPVPRPAARPAGRSAPKASTGTAPRTGLQELLASLDKS
ncbi:MAG: hypothetical protein HOV68_05280 [Streptomycetaceae bacterium]|nr:hypothetical protein [Streptomycetaceae bacterium]